MFNKGIYETTLTGDVADRLFSNITQSTVPDLSFLATLRALLHKRLPQNETVQLECTGLHYSYNTIIAGTVSDCMSWFIPQTVRYPAASEYRINIVYSAYPDSGEKMLEILRANASVVKRHMNNYTQREDLRVFYARKLNAIFYTDDTERNTVIFTDRLELKHFHALQMMIPRYLPSLFIGAPLTETETALLKSVGNKSAVEYETLIGGYAKDFDIRSEIIRTRLAGFETGFERARLDELKNEIADYQADYDRHLAALREFTQKIQDRQYILAGLECAITGHSGDSELMEYFMCNKNLAIISAAGTSLDFIVRGYTDIYDIEAFDKFVANHGGYMYSQLNPNVTKPQMEKLYRAVFSYNRYKLRLCAAYRADMRTGLTPLKHYMFPAESATYFPNPHIQEFSCIGSYAGRFQEYMNKRDYVGAIDQAVVSARNLNFYDSSVISTLARLLSGTSIKCIERRDGTLLTPMEAITELSGGAATCPDPLF